jgi:tRNA G18 (ribose-2'-O)-methylase SpoU
VPPLQKFYRSNNRCVLDISDILSDTSDNRRKSTFAMKWSKEQQKPEYWMRNEWGGEQISLEAARVLPRLPVVGVLDRVRSAHNVGSIFRTADGARLQELVLCGYTPTPPHKHLLKTALRAVESVPWRHAATVEEAIDDLKARGYLVAAMEFTGESTLLYDFDLSFPLAMVFGNEAEGLASEVLSRCDVTLHLPMHGLKSSLNVSVAFGVAAYESVRRFCHTSK